MSNVKTNGPRLAERRRAERIEAVRREIVEAATEEFLERGYHATSLATIAQRLGTGASTIYNYFPSKQAILEAVVDDTFLALTQILMNAASEPPTQVEPFYDWGTALGGALADLVVQHPNQMRMLIVIAAESDPMLRERWSSMHRMASALVEQYLADGVAGGYLHPDLDPAATAAAIIAIPLGMVAAERDLVNDAEQVLKRIQASVALVANGIFRTAPDHRRQA